MAENFYCSIAPWYDRIFPLHEEALAHLSGLADRVSSEGKTRVLDAGCATGAMAVALAAEGHLVTGIDLDPAMISIASQRGALFRETGYDMQEGRGDCRFEVLDMTQLAGRFQPRSFDLVYCLGNTLVHLTEAGALPDFLGQVAEVLKPGGIFSLQIINYDRILDEGIGGLPTIEGDGVVFERRYRGRRDGLIDFETAMTDLATGRRIENSIPLLPLRAGDLENMFYAAGFVEMRFSGNFNLTPLNPRSYLIVADAAVAGG